jgi:hypothetical protein
MAGTKGNVERRRLRVKGVMVSRARRGREKEIVMPIPVTEKL